MRISRFVDALGQIQLGVEQADGSALRIEGELLGQWSVTEQRLVIQRRLSPIVPTSIYAIGRNYAEHAQETGAQIDPYPVVFMKPVSSVCGPDEPIRLPASCQQGPEVDFEAELAVVIGRCARNVAVERALDYVLGYCNANDVTARRWQKHAGGGQWIRGKGFDSFCPLGPWLVTADAIPDPQALNIQARLNGQRMQHSNTGLMLHSVAELISYLSQDTSLLAGTLILTGTPAGVGFARTPPVYLQSGDRIEIEVEHLGCLSNPVL